MKTKIITGIQLRILLPPKINMNVITIKATNEYKIKPKVPKTFANLILFRPMGVFILPQLGQTSAVSDISLPHSEHFIRDIVFYGKKSRLAPMDREALIKLSRSG